ncbi:hypothetical protein PsB1_1568 [Candidatus Phycosocius spiralis]|uniref:YhdP central domain-containing protein n=2 Tax=Candidatus Phycosocius spiralis TaxID=2815099 RepID=A0ABQ4PWR7_9PROT|nr:hypothetical protein PsB1_1568 [Candidatus Phycosocius spiralis]
MRHTRLLLEGAALIIAMGGLCAGYLAWRLSIGTVSIALATPIAEEALGRLVGGKTTIGSLRLGWDPIEHDFVVLAGQITARTDQRTSPLRLGQIDLALDAPSLLAGRAVVKQAKLSSVEAVLVVDQQGRIAFGFGTAQEVLALPRFKDHQGGLARIIQTTRKALDPTGQAGRVAQVVLRNARLQVIDPDSGEQLVLEGAQAGFHRNEIGIITFQASGRVVNTPSSINLGLAVPPDPQGTLSMVAQVQHFQFSQIPQSLRPTQFEQLVTWTSPIGGHILGHLSPNGTIISVAGQAQMGAGQVGGFWLNRAEGRFSWYARDGIIRLEQASVLGRQMRGDNLRAVLFPLQGNSRRIDLNARSFAIQDRAIGGLMGSQVKGSLTISSQARLQNLQLSAQTLGVSSPDTRAVTLMNARLSLSSQGRSAQKGTSGIDEFFAGGMVKGSVRATGLALSDGRGPLGKADQLAMDFAKPGLGGDWQGSASLANLTLFGRGMVWPQIEARGLSASLIGLGTPMQTSLKILIDTMGTRRKIGRGLGLSGSKLTISGRSTGDGFLNFYAMTADALSLVSPVFSAVTGPIRAAGTLSKQGFKDVLVQTSNLSLINPSQIPRPFVATDLRFEGDIDHSRVVFRDAQLRHQGIVVVGNGEVAQAPRGSAKVFLNAQFGGQITVDTLLAAWPRGFLSDVRSAIAQVIRTGIATTDQLTLRIPPGLLQGQIGGPDMIALNFDVRDGTVDYLPGMTALTDVSGRARLTGTSFRFDVAQGKLGPLELKQGYFSIPQFQPKDALAVVHAVVSGSVATMAQEIDREPLHILSKAKIDAARLAGVGEVVLDLGLPLSKYINPETIMVRASGHFEQASLKNVFAGLEANQGEVDLDVVGSRIKVNGQAHVAGNPFEFVWRNHLPPSPMAGIENPVADGSHLVATGMVDLASLNQIGVDVAAYATGPVKVSLDLHTQTSTVIKADVLADVQAARMVLPNSGWSKPVGEPGQIKAQILGQTGFGWQVDGLEFETKSAFVRGQLEFSDQMDLKLADFSQIKIEDVADFGFKLSHRDGSLTLNLVGDYLDLSPFVLRRDVTEKAVNLLKQPMTMTANFKRVATGTVSALDDLEVAMARDQFGWRALRLRGSTPAGPTQIEFLPLTDGRVTISGTLSDVGFFARLLYPGAPLQGGMGVIEGELPIVGAKSEGLLSFQVKDISLLRSNQSPILFDLVRLPMQVNGGVLSLRDGKADSSAYTVKAQGYVDFEQGQMDIRGVATPGGLNRGLGYVPLIGGLLGGGQDEGLVGLTFSAQGSLGNPKVRANPISALAPGFLRKLFETQAPIEPPLRPKSPVETKPATSNDPPPL